MTHTPLPSTSRHAAWLLIPITLCAIVLACVGVAIGLAVLALVAGPVGLAVGLAAAFFACWMQGESTLGRWPDERGD
ncbi:MAG: hypothetical protein MUF16_00200 [Burkholderiaceae bacterium]|jgi:succinate-acetate transporter protein|nr:hypothetical protein [Burkholderiaceae bacterium]